MVFYYFNTYISALAFTYFIVGHSRALILYLSYVYFIRFFLQLENDRREIEISFFIASFYSEMCFKKLLIRHRMKRKRLSSYNIETTPVVFWGLAEICVKLQFVSSLKFFYYQPFSRPFHCGRHWTFKQTNKQTKKQTNTINLLLMTRSVTNFSPLLLRILWAYLLFCTNLHLTCLTWVNNCFLSFLLLTVSNPAISIKWYECM